MFRATFESNAATASSVVMEAFVICLFMKLKIVESYHNIEKCLIHGF